MRAQIIKTTNKDGKTIGEFILKRDSWKELFRFEISHDSMARMDGNQKVIMRHMIRHFKPAVEIENRATTLYVRIPLCYLVELYFWIALQWKSVAVWFIRKGYLRAPEGTRFTWFWFKYLRFKKKKVENKPKEELPEAIVEK